MTDAVFPVSVVGALGAGDCGSDEVHPHLCCMVGIKGGGERDRAHHGYVRTEGIIPIH